MTQGQNATVAVVDLGSVSSQLLVTDGESRLRRTIDTTMGGSSLSPTGQLRAEAIGDEALSRVAAALEQFSSLVPSDSSLAAVATASARRATNSQALIDLVDRILGVKLDIIDAGTEARLNFLGVISDPTIVPDDPSEWIITIDVGGGSTEFALGTINGPEATFSVPVGGALITGAYLIGDPPRPEELSAALSVIELHIDDVRRALPRLDHALQSATVIGSGAISTIAAIEIGLADEDPDNGVGDGPLHRFELTKVAVEDVFRTIATENRADRGHNPGLPASRVADIVGACALLVETMRQLDLASVIVSQRSLLDGIATEMLMA